MRNRNLKAVRLAVVALMLMTAACSGAKDNSAAGGKGSEVKAGEAAGETTTDSVLDPNAPATDGAAPGQETPGADGTAVTGSGSGSGGTGTKSGTSASGGGGGGTAAAVPGSNLPNLFTDKEDRIGISDKQITLCGHAALTFAEAFDTRPQDLSVYWEMVKDRGGVHGRNVSISWEDDAYRPDQAVVAAQACKGKNPFLLLGGIGFDQIPAVRNWAEQNRMLYIHHIATEAGTEGKQFSFTPLPSVEKTGQMFAELIIKKYKSKKVGILYRQSEFWAPGFEAAQKLLSAAGVKPVVLPVQKDQAVYAQQIRELNSQGVEVVWAWENALVATEMFKQAQAQNYKPKWLVFPFNTTTDALTREEATQPTLEGIATWPAYSQGDYTSGLYGQYADEIKRFEAAYAKYRPGVKPNDILWMTWLSFKGLDDLFQTCGADCTRSKFANILRGGYKKTVAPGCETDFTRHPLRGGYQVNVFESYAKGNTGAWKPTVLCREHL